MKLTLEAGTDDPVRRRVLRLLHVPPLALLLGLGLAPFFLLFPLLPGEPGHDLTARPVELWLATALLGGLLGGLDGTARHLYRAAGLVLTATLLSAIVMPMAVRSGLPFSHRLATVLGSDGEYARDAALYEIWLTVWLACMALLLLCRYVLRNRRAGVLRARRAPH